MPSYELRPETIAFNMIFGKSASGSAPKCMNASVWFTSRDASRFNVVEESFEYKPTR